MSALAQHTVWTAYLQGGASIGVGYCVVLNSAGTGFVVASLANRTAAGRDAAAVALTAADDEQLSFEPQITGMVSASITQLGAGTVSAIRVADSGLLERCSNSASDIVGKCDTDGTAYVDFSIPWDAVIAVAATPPTGTGFVRVTSGVQEAAASAVNLAGGSSHVTGTLPLGNGGTGLTAVGTALQYLRTNAGATAMEWATLSVLPNGSAAGQALIWGGVSWAAGALDLADSDARTGTLPVANGGTGITSLGAGMATWWGTPSSANLAATVTDETGSGALVFANTPTLVTPVIGAATGTSLAVSSFLRVGTGTISTGAVRIDNGTFVYSETTGGTDVRLLGFESTDTLLVGSSGQPSNLIGSTTGVYGDTIELRTSNGITNRLVITATAATFSVPTVATSSTVTSHINLGDTSANVASTGTVRVKGGFSVNSVVGGTDRKVLEATTGAEVVVGGMNAGECAGVYIRVQSGGDARVQINGSNKQIITESLNQAGVPRVGDSTAYASEGRAALAMADANQVAGASIYSRACIRLTGALTAGRTLTLPHPASEDASYRKLVDVQGITGGFLVTVTTGTGTSADAVSSTISEFMVTPSGVQRLWP